MRECTASSIETAFSALRDADNDVQVAIELILDGNCEDSWMDPFAKKTKAKKQHEQKSKVEKGKEQPKTGSNQSLNDKKASANADAPKVGYDTIIKSFLSRSLQSKMEIRKVPDRLTKLKMVPISLLGNLARNYP